MSSIFVILYGRDWPSPIITSSLYYEGDAGDAQAAPPQAETNTNFLGRFASTKHFLLPLLIRNAATDTAVVQSETNISFLGRYIPGRFLVDPRLRQSGQADAQPESNPSFLGRYSATVYARMRYGSEDDSIPQPETNTHWIGRFQPGTFKTFWLNTWDTGVPQAETNPHFIGRYAAPQHRLLLALRQSPALDGEVETNVHWIARLTPTKFIVSPALRQNVPNDGPVPPVPETNPHFIATFRTATIWRFRLNSWDTAVPEPETNPHQIGKHRTAAHQVNPALRQTPANDVPPIVVQETNTNFIGRTAAPSFRTFRLNSTDTAVPQRETNPHFVGHYRANRHVLLPGLRQNVPSDIFVQPIQPETNPHFIARYRPGRFRPIFPNPVPWAPPTPQPGEVIVKDQALASVVARDDGLAMVEARNDALGSVDTSDGCCR